MYTTINNPGRGNCAFYSFSIALIDLIKHEYHRQGLSVTFNHWTAYFPEIEEQLNAILNFNFKKQNKALLDTLQASLRELVYQTHYEQLQNGLEVPSEQISHFIENQTIFNKFGEIFWEYHTHHKFRTNQLACNDLAKSLAVKRLVVNLSKRLKQNKIVDPRPAIARTFLEDVYGLHFDSLEEARQLNENHSVILKAIEHVKNMDSKKRNYLWWGTHSDLNILAEKFEVNLHCYINGKGTPLAQDGRPVIKINNEHNVHWTTFIETSNAQENPSTKNYQRFWKDSLVTKEEIKEIYLTYTTGFYSWFGRNHQNKAEEIIRFCDDPAHTVADIITTIQNYINDDNIRFNQDSSFRKRANYILARNDFYNGVIEQQEPHNEIFDF